METRQILKRVYPELTAGAGPLARRRRGVAAARGWIARKARTVAAVLLLLTGWVVAHLYYYNKLVGMEFDVVAAWAQVETQLQRRHHIQRNLTRMVIDYAEHERSVLTGITKLRTAAAGGGVCSEDAAPPSLAAGAPGSPADAQAPAAVSTPGTNAGARPLEQLSPKELQELFSRIMVVAEQYPQLKLSENFQQFSAAVIDTETEIAAKTSAYNDAVNKYGTTLNQFPGNIFAWLGGFEEYEFYRPDTVALKFRRVEY